MADRIDLSLDDIIKLNKKDKNGPRGRGRGGVRGRGRGAGGTPTRGVRGAGRGVRGAGRGVRGAGRGVRGAARGVRGAARGVRGASRGAAGAVSGVKAFRGRVGGKKVQGVSPFNRQGTLTGRGRGVPRGRGTTRGRGSARGAGATRGASRGRGAGRGARGGLKQMSQAQVRVAKAKQTLTLQMQRQSKQNRQDQVYLNRGLQSPQNTYAPRGRGRGRLNRNFGVMQSDVIVQQDTKRQWRRKPEVAAVNDPGLMTISVANKRSSGDVSVILPGQGQGQGAPRGRGAGRRGGRRGGARPMSAASNFSRAGSYSRADSYSMGEEIVITRQQSSPQGGGGGGRGRGAGRGRGGRGARARGASPRGSPRGRGGAGSMYVQDIDPNIQSQIQQLRPSVSTSYAYSRKDFSKDSTEVSLNDRFGRSVTYATGPLPAPGTRQVFM